MKAVKKIITYEFESLKDFEEGILSETHNQMDQGWLTLDRGPLIAPSEPEKPLSIEITYINKS